MNNTLVDLNNYLFEALERINDDSLSPEQFEIELRRSKAVTSVAEVIVHNGELALQTMKHLNEYGYDGRNLAPIPAMLESKHGQT